MASPASPISALPVSMAEVDMVLRREFEALFGATADQAVGSTENTASGPQKIGRRPLALIEASRAPAAAPAGLDTATTRAPAETPPPRAVARLRTQPRSRAERLVFDEGAEADALHAAATTTWRMMSLLTRALPQR